jgi:tetratricopeptide (TPR) repeat protein
VHSVPTLQAVDIATEARALYFPVFDARRQQIALDMYQYATELAPGLPDGFAGSAQVLATLHMIAPDNDQRRAYLEGATAYAKEALARAPTNAWAVAADAWVLAQSGKSDEALRRARLALDLAPNDGHILDLVGVVAIYANDPSLAAMVSDPASDRQGVKRTGTQNIWGLSNLMLGENLKTIAAFDGAVSDGTVVSAPSLMFLAVAHKRNGDETKAAALLAELRSTWPQFPAEFLISRVFATNPEMRDEILDSYMSIEAER